MEYQLWLNKWLDDYVKPFLKTNTYLTYFSEVRNHIIPYLGLLEIEKIQDVDIQYCILTLMKKGNKRNNLPLANSHINLIISIIIRSINKYYEIYKNTKITLNIQHPKLLNSKIKALSVKEEGKLVDYILEKKKIKYYGFIICIYTGIRIGELLALTWEDIDFDNKLINIHKTIAYCNSQISVENCFNSPKTPSSIRKVPLTNFLINIFKQIKKVSDSDYVISYKERNKCKRSYQKSFSNLLKKLNIKGHTFHSTRHTFATRLLENKVNPKAVSELLGHSNILTTLKIYSSCFLEEKRKSMEQLTKKYSSKRII